MSHRTPFSSGLPLALLLTATLVGRYVSAAEPSVTVVAKLDKDGDHTLDWAEVQAGADTRFDNLNKDHDGTLDVREVQGIIGKATFKAADPDNDGTLSKMEYRALVKRLVEQADANHDGTLDARELSSKAGRRLQPLIE